ncbi:hypothetical protein AA0X95_12885 [Bacillus sp. 1P10SD]|uniref:hypothetical protein n=1 Tax=Bacillus sp. 1P10SD TaxID=3132265 RepID=UPI0039A57D44
MRFFFRLFKVNKILSMKIAELEKKISSLEATMNEFQHMAEPESKCQPTDPKERESPPNILIEQLKVDQIVIHHVDYANNFGQLGIKELSGRLNIGTNYEGELTDKISEKVNEKLNEKLGRTAKVNVRAKKEEPS